jgi:hypothetical protein
MNVTTMSLALPNHVIPTVDIINADSVIMGSNGKPVSIWGIFHYFVPLLCVSEGVNDVVNVVVISSDSNLAFVI